jgi:hypothetical protein
MIRVKGGITIIPGLTRMIRVKRGITIIPGLTRMIRVKGGITIIPGLTRMNNKSTSHIVSFIFCLIRLNKYSLSRIFGHLIIDWYPCHMLPVEPWKLSSLLIDKKYQNGQSRNHYQIII